MIDHPIHRQQPRPPKPHVWLVRGKWFIRYAPLDDFYPIQLRGRMWVHPQ